MNLWLLDASILFTDDAELVRADAQLLESAVAIAEEHGISAYDAAYFAAARVIGGRLVSCDQRDLVSPASTSRYPLPSGVAAMPTIGICKWSGTVLLTG